MCCEDEAWCWYVMSLARILDISCCFVRDPEWYINVCIAGYLRNMYWMNIVVHRVGIAVFPAEWFETLDRDLLLVFPSSFHALFYISLTSKFIVGSFIFS